MFWFTDASLWRALLLSRGLDHSLTCCPVTTRVSECRMRFPACSVLARPNGEHCPALATPGLPRPLQPPPSPGWPVISPAGRTKRARHHLRFQGAESNCNVHGTYIVPAAVLLQCPAIRMATERLNSEAQCGIRLLVIQAIYEVPRFLGTSFILSCDEPYILITVGVFR